MSNNSDESTKTRKRKPRREHPNLVAEGAAKVEPDQLTMDEFIVSVILREHWNPIGCPDWLPGDEYDDYAVQVVTCMRSHGDVEALLVSICDTMFDGLFNSQTCCDRVLPWLRRYFDW